MIVNYADDEQMKVDDLGRDSVEEIDWEDIETDFEVDE